MRKPKDDEPKKSRQLAAWLPQSKLAAKKVILRDAVHLLLIFSILTGCAPASALLRCRFRDVLQLCYFVAGYALLILAAWLEFHQTDRHYIDLLRTLYALESCLHLANLAFILQLSLRWRHRFDQLIHSIAEFDLLSGYNEHGDRAKRFVMLQLLLVLIFICIAIPVDIWLNKYNFGSIVRTASTHILPNIIESISFVQYYVLLHGVASRLAALNKSLALELQRTPFPRDAVQRLRLQHVRLMRFTKRVNQTFGISVVLIYVNASINLSLQVFLLYKFIDSPTKFDAGHVNMVLWACLQAGKMYSIIYFNHCVQRQQTHCVGLLSRARCENEAAAETLKHFSLQLNMNVREHVVCGLIVLDFKLLTAIIMFIVNIFIFLLQYDITFEALMQAKNATKS